MNESITIRRRTDTDTQAIERVAALDSGRAPEGDALVAVVGDEIRAVLPLDCGRPLADPFHRTAELVELLEVSAREVRCNGARAHGVLRRPLWLAPRVA